MQTSYTQTAEDRRADEEQDNPSQKSEPGIEPTVEDNNEEK